MECSEEMCVCCRDTHNAHSMVWCTGGHGMCRVCTQTWAKTFRASLYKPLECPECKKGIPFTDLVA